MDSKQLLQQQLSAAPRSRKPKAAKPSAQTGIEYNVELQRIVKALHSDINRTLLPVIKNIAPEYQRDNAPIVIALDSWVDILTSALQTLRDRWTNTQFQSLANDMARRFVRSADDANTKRLNIDVYGDSQELTNHLQAATANSVQLITSIPQQHLNQVESIVFANVRAGGRPSTIAAQLQKQFGITQRRAKMIARDQTSKINSELSRIRQTSAGFPYFEWVDSDDERVRDRHQYLADHVTQYGKGVYRWDDLPLSDSGEPIAPGMDYQCRCIARPVSQAEVDGNIEAGRTRPGVKR